MQPFFNHVWTGRPELNQYKAGDKVSCLRTQRSASGMFGKKEPIYNNLVFLAIAHKTPRGRVIFKRTVTISDNGLARTRPDTDLL